MGTLEEMITARSLLGLKKPRRRMPIQLEPRAIEREYARAILEVLARTHDILRPTVQAMPRLLDGIKAERGDAGELEQLAAMLSTAKGAIARMLDQTDLNSLARKFADRTQTWQRIQLNKQVKSVIGADPFLRDPKLASMIDGFALENVDLIEDISDEAARKLTLATSRALSGATPHPDLAKEIAGIFEGNRKRARLVARDQVGKLYGQVNKARQEELGVTEFIWRTSNDSRVRSEHVRRNRKTYEWDNPPDGEAPGQPILCRCYAEPVIEF